MILSGTETNDIDDIVLEYKVVSVNTGQEGQILYWDRFLPKVVYTMLEFKQVKHQVGVYIYELIKNKFKYKCNRR